MTQQLARLAHLIVPLLLVFLIPPAEAVFIQNFDDCLSSGYKSTAALQWTPHFVDVVFNTTDPTHNLRVTVWGNVSGSVYDIVLPPPQSSDWTNPNVTDGKITNLTTSTNKLATLASKFQFLSYTPWSSTLAFCDQIRNGTCPLAPTFSGNASNYYTFPYFQMNNNFGSTYSFASLTATILIINGDEAATNLGCISAPITPDLGSSISNVLTFLPLVALIFVAISTAFAGIFSPWGTTDVFRWTSNYGRDADLLRLVTPGFGDCLQYIQFVCLTGGLTLLYPGYYQPVMSKVAWSSLMFNQSFVSEADGYQSLVDGIYVTNGQYGLNDLSQLVGLAGIEDIWAGMVIWLLVILATMTFIIQVGFLIRWLYRQYSGTQEEDLRAKNMPFSVGNAIRIVFSYFLLPIVAFSMFQLVEAGKSPVYTVVLAAVLLLIIIVFAAWLLYVIASTRPRAYLFDDLPTVLLYGPLYNTYSDNAAPFALIPVLLTFVRGIAIGALTVSGIAQLVVLAICEVITILTLHAFRPFHSPTSMNAYHTVFATSRFLSVLLMVAFAPSLGVTDGPKGWVGYAILLLHAGVLVFGFMLNALQTIVEVAARMAGAGGDERGGLVKVFGMRQLSKRLPRDNAASRQSMLSTSQVLDAEQKSAYMDNGRTRSQSVGSAGILLDRPHSMGFDTNIAGTPTTPAAEASMFSFLPATANPVPNRNRNTIMTLSNTEGAIAADPYYRPPRQRRPTLSSTPLSPDGTHRTSWMSGAWTTKSNGGMTSTTHEPDIGPSVSGRGTPVGILQTYDPASDTNRRSQTDYTTREVDFYYGVRGPALNANVPGRRLRTGPTDPTNSIASIGGFFKGLLGGKTKEKGKGFEVVRSSRMPPGMKARNLSGDESPPEGIPVAAGVVRNGPIDSDDDEPLPPRSVSDAAHRTLANADGHHDLEDGDDNDNDLSSMDGDEGEFEMTRISDVPPSISLDIPSGADLGIPSRIGSLAKTAPNRTGTGPRVPRKSSKRQSQTVSLTPSEARAMVSGPEAQMPISTREYPGTLRGDGIDEPPSPISSIDTEHRPYLDSPDQPKIHRISRHQPTLSTGSTSSQTSRRMPFERTGSKRQSTISTRSSILPPRSAEDDQDFGHGQHVAYGSAVGGGPGMPGNGHVHTRSVQTVYPRGNVDLMGSQAELVDMDRFDDNEDSREYRTAQTATRWPE